MISSLAMASDLIARSVNTGKIPGAVLGVIEPSGQRFVQPFGAAQLIPSKRVMQADTWFDLASLTKVLFTTPRILEHAVKGRIDLDAPLTDALPDLRQYDSECWERKVTFRQCLSHQTPFPAVEPLYTYGQNENLLRAFVLQRQWRASPTVYSDINFILLGIALERIEGCTIRAMHPGDGFAFSSAPETTAATEDCTWRNKILCGEVHDDNCYALKGSGHAGLFGTANAILNYADGLLASTVHSPDVISHIRTPVSPSYTHGWQYFHEGWSGGDSCSAETIGHTGFTGTGLWIDFDKQRAWTLLTNRIHPSRHSDSGIDTLRRSVSDALSTH